MGVKLQLVLGLVIAWSTCILEISTTDTNTTTTLYPPQDIQDERKINLIEKLPKTDTVSKSVNKNTHSNSESAASSEIGRDSNQSPSPKNALEKDSERDNSLKKDVAVLKGRGDNSRSIDIERFVSPDFQNNDFTLTVSSDTEKYLEGPFSLKSSTRKGSDFGRFDLTTPRTAFFDNKFTEVIQKLEQEYEENRNDGVGDHDSNEHDRSHEHSNAHDHEHDIHEHDMEHDHENPEIGVDEDMSADNNEELPKNISVNIKQMKIMRNNTVDKNSGRNDTTVTVVHVRKFDYITNFNDTKMYNYDEPKGEQSNLNSTTPKMLPVTTRKTITLTKPSINKNNSHILSNKIETETLKAINIVTTDAPTTKAFKAVSESRNDLIKEHSEDNDHFNSVLPVKIEQPVNQIQETTLASKREINFDKAVTEKSYFNLTEASVITSTLSASTGFTEGKTEKILEMPTEKNTKFTALEITEQTTDLTATVNLLSELTTKIENQSTESETTEAIPSTTEKQTVEYKTKTTNSMGDIETTEREVTESQITEVQNTEPQTSKMQNTEHHTTEIQDTQPQTTEIQNSQRQTTEIQDIQPQTTEIQSAQPQTTEIQSIQHQTTEIENTQPQTTEIQNTETQTTELQNTEQQITENFNTETQTTEILNTKPQKTEDRILENQTTESQLEDINATTNSQYTKGKTRESKETILPATTTFEETTDIVTKRFNKHLNKDATTFTQLEETITTSSDRHNLADAVTSRITTTTLPLSTTIISTTAFIDKTETISLQTTTVKIEFIHLGSASNGSVIETETLEPSVNYPISTKTTESSRERNNIVGDTTSHTTSEETDYITETSSATDNIVNNPDEGKGKVAAIVISSVGAICLVLLAGLLYIMRKRQKRFNYIQNCRPVSLDEYNVDNVSAFNSVRRKGVLRVSKRSYGNPAFDDPSVPTHPLNFPAMAKFADNVEDMKAEFEDIPQVSARTSELPEGCETKNRYANVIPLPETRVFLQPIEGSINSDYINANYVTGPKNIKGYYIACQGPMLSTVDDFWRMVWEANSKVILMLTHLFENGVEKCADYLPPSEVLDCHRLFGDFQVTLKKRDVKEKYIISSLQLKNMVSNSWREVTHFWYLGWPEKGVPSEANSLIAFLIEARSYMKSSILDKNGSSNGQVTASNANSDVNPVVVHCSPGTGRTGVVIACDIAIREFEKTRLVDIPKIVSRIRRDRASSVQTKEQYMFIYKVVSLYATKLTGGALDSF